MDYKLISCDDHLDMNQLPADLWTSRLAAPFHDRAPHIEEYNGRAVWLCEGQNWGSWAGKSAPDSGPKPLFTAVDRGNVDQSQLRAGVPELRLADMDRDGVYTHLIFGPVLSINFISATRSGSSNSAMRSALTVATMISPISLCTSRKIPWCFIRAVW